MTPDASWLATLYWEDGCLQGTAAANSILSQGSNFNFLSGPHDIHLTKWALVCEHENKSWLAFKIPQASCLHLLSSLVPVSTISAASFPRLFKRPVHIEYEQHGLRTRKITQVGKAPVTNCRCLSLSNMPPQRHILCLSPEKWVLSSPTVWTYLPAQNGNRTSLECP